VVGDGDAPPTLFRSDDAAESADLAPERAESLREMERRLRGFHEELRARSRPGARLELDEDELERLERLGYAGEDEGDDGER
jgi:hypothetical protein